MKSWKKVLIGIAGTIIIIVIFLFLISYFMLRKSLPEYDGEFIAEGLIAGVEVHRDSFAIPMISAQNDEDAAFALGFVHAQERLFQMDLARRAGEGRLSEVFGSKTIPVDKMFRTVGIYKVVEESLPKINPVSLKILKAYSRGVNKFIEHNKGKYQIEFDVLGYDPYPWKPEHSLVIAKLMGWELNVSWWSDILFSNLINKLGPDKAAELLPGFPENAPTIIPKNLPSISSADMDFINVDRMFRDFTGFVGTHIGSNNWVVSGKMSASQKPVIANDPHLSLSVPGKWYFAMIRSDNWNAEGFTIPGLPAVVIGKNRNIAWAMTNVMADDCDFYSERLDSTGSRYYIDNQLRNLTVYTDSFAVKDSLHYKFTIRKSHRGPIISDVHTFNNIYPGEGKVKSVLSMRWTGLEFSDEMFAAISINKADNWEDFKSALRFFTVPGQNFIYADINGNIGYVCAARLPVRSNVSPSLVYDGTTSESDWKGFVPYEEMPKLYNPPQEFIATANNKTSSVFKYHISNVWEPSSRIERIVELLNSRKQHSVSDFKKYQLDFISPYAKEIIPFVLRAFADAKINDKNLRTAVELLENWNYELSASSQVPTIYLHFFHRFIRNIFEDELGRDLLKEYVFLANIPYRIILKYLNENSSSFFDDIRTAEIESRDQIIRKSLVDALSELEKNLGTDISMWQWGKIHKVYLKHFFANQSGLVDQLINIGPYEIGGDGTTVFNTEYSFPELYEERRDFTKPYRSEPFQNILGPSMRYIYDFGNPDFVEIILPAGQSGHFMNDHYKDMTGMWLTGDYVRIPVSEKIFKSKAGHLLKLLPGDH